MRVVRNAALAGLLLTFIGGAAYGQSERKVLANPAPVYPELARRMHLTGMVKVVVIIGADGQIKNEEFQGGHPVLINAVQSALKDWKYAPGPSETKVMLEFKF
jgi:TonB family protein